MKELRTDIYVAIRTAPKTARKNLSGALPQIGDKAASDVTECVMKALEKYDITPKKRDKPIGFSTH